ncbi:hypothetical protein ACQP00_20295 [Dactylosporangium sp. CS-047395]|uniref:hypothetical protein n=1 Tax=Dactylosporangium sp. CS-047395 TaxID=3239936 RepID=UPI003D8F55B4
MLPRRANRRRRHPDHPRHHRRQPRQLNTPRSPTQVRIHPRTTRRRQTPRRRTPHRPRAHRKEILQQRVDYISAIETTNRARPDQTAKLAIGYDEQHPTTIDIHGGSATVTQYWQAQFDFARHEIGGPLGYTSDPLPWTATAHQDRDGWRLTSINMPPWCGTLNDDGTATGYVKCD